MNDYLKVNDKRAWRFQIDADVYDIYGPEIGAHALLVYMALARHAGLNGGDCYPSLKYMASRLCISTRTITRAIATLASAGLIKVVPRYKDNGGRRSNAYDLLPVPRRDEINKAIS